MSKHTDKNQQADGWQSELQQYECEQALLRRHFETPSVETEWQKWQEQSRKRQSMRRKNVTITLFVSIAVTAAAIACFLVLHPNRKVERSTAMQIIYLAQKEEPTISVEEYTENGHMDKKTHIRRKEDEKALGNGAVLSAQQADYSHLRNEAPKTNVITIPRGQTYKMLLNDGTEVYMNADSKLVYPTCFNHKERVVRLQGEAYFKVRHDSNRPFIVLTGRTKISVLGTEFNVKSYEGSDEHVTLIHGSVHVRMPGIAKGVLLTPGEDIVYTVRTGEYQVRNVDTNLYTYWKDGYFYFDDMYLADILKELGYWYNVTIEMEETPSLRKSKLHFVADKNENIRQIIEHLNALNSFLIYQEKGKLIVRRKKQ